MSEEQRVWSINSIIRERFRAREQICLRLEQWNGVCVKEDENRQRPG